MDFKASPYDGGTFRDARISEAGRQLLARELSKLNDEQLAGLFTAARFREFHGGKGRSADVNAWAETLRKKIRLIADGDRCPN